MTPRTARLSRLAASLAAAFTPVALHAVSLNPDGLGQALIYPYYTVRSSDGNAFNTYLSVVNHTSDAKAVRVRVREGRAAKEVLSFNLYLSPNDVWSAAIGPTGAGAAIHTIDTSCTDPVFTGTAVSTLEFRDNLYTGSLADGFGDTLDRTREGYVEMIEMATLTNESRVAVTHNSAGVPANCAAIRAGSPSVARPTGGLSGTLTLINVASGQDFTVNAEALADLASRPFFRPPADPYPDFAATEIDAVSAVVANGQLYRSTWTRPVDAVSAVLMRDTWLAEYSLDIGTASQTDVVTALPTRHHYASPTGTAPPFSRPAAWSNHCGGYVSDGLGEHLRATFFNREARGAISAPSNFPVPPPNEPVPRLCAAAAVGSVQAGVALTPFTLAASAVFGSTTLGAHWGGRIGVVTGFQGGWIHLQPMSSVTIASLPGSTRQDLATGVMTGGAHVYFGLPVVGFAARTFRNGTLTCTSGACQGNYGGAFPFKYTRRITPP